MKVRPSNSKRNPEKLVGFASLSPEQLRAVSRKGGSVKTRKGLATLTPEQRSDIARKGALAMHANRKSKEEHEQDSISEWD